MPSVFRQGDHICSLFETEDEQITMAAKYLADGLQRGERAFYVAQSNAAMQRFRGAMRANGVNVAAALKKGALVESTHADAHLADGQFDSERMLRLLNEAVELALNDGFTGLRTCGDMSWLLAHPEGADTAIEYEALLNQFFRGVRAAGMCQYDIRRLPPDLVHSALATHSSACVDGTHRHNTFYQSQACSTARGHHTNDLAWKIGELRRASMIG
jgi:hypothetical protein